MSQEIWGQTSQWWIGVAAVFLLAGFVKGVVGLGLPTVAVGLLGVWMAPAYAAALLVVPSLVTNLWQLALGPALRPLLRRLWPMLLASGLVCVAATLVLGGAAGPWAVRVLGVVLVVYGALGLAQWKPRLTPVQERRSAWLVGVATGLVTAATGVFMVPAVPWLQAIGLEKDELVQALGLSFTVSTVALALGLAATGHLPGGVAASSLAMLLPALAGMGLGQLLRRRISPAVFRRCFLSGVLLLGLYLALR